MIGKIVCADGLLVMQSQVHRDPGHLHMDNHVFLLGLASDSASIYPNTIRLHTRTVNRPYALIGPYCE